MSKNRGRRLGRWAAVLMVVAGTAAFPGCRSTSQLAGGLRPFSRALRGRDKQFALTLGARVPIDKRTHEIDIRIERHGDDAFFLFAKHKDYAFRLLRDAKRTVLELPKHKVAFIGEGAVPVEESLRPKGFQKRLLSRDTGVRTYLKHLTKRGPFFTAVKLRLFARLRRGDDGAWNSPLIDDVTIAFADEPPAANIKLGKGDIQLTRGSMPDTPFAAAVSQGMREVPVDRAEMERLLIRGWGRALEVLAPAGHKPKMTTKRVPHGRLEWHDGQRLVLLEGSPEQIGRAHGMLLEGEIRKCMDSVLYAIGFVDTVRSGKWFPDQLRDAYRRLSPNMPADHLAETDALADAAGLAREELQLGNIFPELFHCSGFAVFGKATKDGTLYHGRVLDYMTHLGLQDAAATFIVKPDGKIPFVNVGYAGFIGSVTGMNARQIGLGEMGGGGTGKWDGVPMSTLMRRALEECETLDQVKELWSESPRTCEYYYVFSDAKIPYAVGVKAVPESIEFILPGQTHPQLGEGIEDAVLLSSGGRLRKLRERAQKHYGKIDTAAALELMSRPVAMKSNLHNALFVPGEGKFYVANAKGKKPAAECGYVEFDFNALLNEFPLTR